MDEKGRCALRFGEWYARVNAPKRQLKNITEMIRSSETDRILSLYYGDEKYIHKRISDFEYFAELCRLMPNIDKMLIGELLLEACALLLDFKGDADLLSNEEAVCTFWKKGNALVESCEGDYARILKKIGVDLCYDVQALSDATSRVEKYNTKDDDATFFADLCDLAFVRPDPYHAHLAQEKARGGQRLSSEEEACVCYEILYLSLRDATCLPTLHLQVDDDGKTATEFIDYLRRRDIRAQILLRFDDTISPETVAALCARSGDGVTVCPEIVVGATDSHRNLYTRLCRFAAIYPMSKWYFGGRKTDSLIFFATRRHISRVWERMCCEQ